MADKYVIVSSQNLIGLQNSINNMLAQGYQPLGSLVQTNNMFYQGMANLTGTPVAFGNVTGISELFRQVSQINDKDLFRQALGGLFLGYNADNAKPGNWKPSADEILNLSDVVRTFLKTSTREGMRSTIGAGTSNLVVGLGADEAKPGNWLPDVSEISGTSQVIEALLESNNEDGARAAIGAGTSNLKVGTGATDAKAGNWLPKKTDIQELSATLVNLLAAVDQAAARAAIGAGTSSLSIGNGSNQAKAGDWRPATTDITDVTLNAVQNLLRSTGAQLSVSDRAALKTMLAFGSSDLQLGTTSGTAKPGDWKPGVSDVTDITLQSVQNLLKNTGVALSAADRTILKNILGFGQSDLTLGSTSTTAKVGDWKPTAADVSDITNGAILAFLKYAGTDLTAAQQLAIRNIIGAGTSSLAIGTTSGTAKSGDYRPAVSDVSDISSAAVQSLLRYNGTALSAAVQLALRGIIGAGTSSLVTGTTADTAKPGNYAPAVEELTNATDLGKSVLKASTVAAILQVITGNTPQTNAFLRGDGTWQTPAGTTYSNATTTSAGLMSGSDKQKLDNIAAPLFTVVAANGRPIDTAFMIDSARHADVTYSFSATLNATISASQNVQIDCQVDGATVARLAIGITLTLAVTVGMTFPFTHSATFRVPAGKQVKFVKTGTAAVAVSVVAGQEVLL